MEQRRLRLGDIVDDYCPRERRVTNHAIVAMIEEDVRQTRCTTCDAEHAYKGARVPRRRKKETPAALFKDVLAGMSDVEHTRAPDGVPPAPESLPTTLHAMSEPARGAAPDVAEEPQLHMPSDQRAPQHHDAPTAPSAPATARADEADRPGEESTPSLSGEALDEPSLDGPVHRRLIRATLPRPEGQKDARPLPDFTVRQAPGRNGNSSHYRGERMRGRGGHAGGQGEANGNRSHGPHARGQGGRSGGGRPPGRGGGHPGFRGGHAGPKGGRRGRGSR
jgi:translation initiation factor IF-2